MLVNITRWRSVTEIEQTHTMCVLLYLIQTSYTSYLQCNK